MRFEVLFTLFFFLSTVCCRLQRIIFILGTICRTDVCAKTKIKLYVFKIQNKHCRSTMLSASDYNNNNMYDLDPNCTQWIRIMRVRVCALSFEINI